MAEDEEELLDEEEGELNYAAIIIAAVLALALIGGAVWFFFLRETPEVKVVELPKWEPPAELAEEVVREDLPELIINPYDSQGRYFLIVKVAVAVNDRAIVRKEVINKPWRFAQIQNIIIDIFSGYTVEELRTPKVREETRQLIKDEFNTIVGWSEPPEGFPEGMEIPPPVKEIYFSKYVLQ